MAGRLGTNSVGWPSASPIARPRMHPRYRSSRGVGVVCDAVMCRELLSRACHLDDPHTAHDGRQVARQRFYVKPRSGSSTVSLPLLGPLWGAILVNRMRPRQMVSLSGRGTKDPYVARAGVRAAGSEDCSAGVARFGSFCCDAGRGWAVAGSGVTADELLARRLLAPALSRLLSIVFAPRKCR